MKLTNSVKTFFAIVLTIVLVWLLATQVNFLEVFTLLKNISLPMIAVSFILYIFGNIGRSIRFYRLLNWKKSFHEIFSIVCVHTFFINLLPARTGELSYFYLTKKRDISLTKGGSVLIIVRILDIISVALILLLSVLFAEALPAIITKFFYLVAALLISCLLLLFSLVYLGTQFMSVIKKIFLLIGLEKSRVVKWVFEKGEEIAESFKILKSKRVFLENLAYSLFIWVSRFIFFYLITLSLGIHVSFWIAVIGITLPMLSTFFPVQGLANFGTLEGAWAISFISLGVSKEVAILTGFGFHLMFLFYAVVMGVYGFTTLAILKSKKTLE